MKTMKAPLRSLLALAILPVALLAADEQKKDDKKADAKSPVISTKVITTVIGPDGKVHTTTSGDDIPDLNKIIQEATGEALGKGGGLQLDKLLQSVDGSVTVIGPDGKATTKKLSGTGGLQQIINEAINGAIGEGVQAQVVDVEKPFIQQKGAVRKEIAEIRKELAEQRKLLEQILEKLK
jgi:hypothetical protein